jgi:hypothetical protein
MARAHGFVNFYNFLVFFLSVFTQILMKNVINVWSGRAAAEASPVCRIVPRVNARVSARGTR